MEIEVSTADEVLAECSDEEEYSKLGEVIDGNWTPNAEDVVDLYEKISVNKVLELSWVCPGRRAPGQENALAVHKPEPEDKKEPTPEIGADFDFEEEVKPTLIRPGSGKSTPKGGAKKKTTSFASIISNMERHHIIEETTENARSLLQSSPSKRPPVKATVDSIKDSIDRVLERQALLYSKETLPGPIITTVPSSIPTTISLFSTPSSIEAEAEIKIVNEPSSIPTTTASNVSLPPTTPTTSTPIHIDTGIAPVNSSAVVPVSTSEDTSNSFSIAITTTTTGATTAPEIPESLPSTLPQN